MKKSKKEDMPSAEAFRRTRRFARESALRLFYQFDVQQRWIPEPGEVEHFWKQLGGLEDAPPGCSLADARKYVDELVQGMAEKREALDERLAEAAENWRVDRMSIVDRNILRLAAYEIMFCEAIPPVTSIDEAVELAKEFGDRDSWRFVNGILDRLLREAD